MTASLLVGFASVTACGHFGVEIGFSADDPDASANVDGGGDDGSTSADGSSDAAADARDGGPIVCQGPNCPVIYVAGEPVGNDTNPGTGDKPVATIQKGIDLAKAIGAPYRVHVAARPGGGKYGEAFTIAEGISLFGQFECAALPCSWDRRLDDQALATHVAGTDYRGIVVGDAITRATVIDGFTIFGKGQTPDVAPGGIALTILGAPTVRNCRVEASGVIGGIDGAKRSIGVAIFGPATSDPNGPLLENNVVRSQQAPEESVALWIDVRGTVAANVNASATIIGNNIIRSGPAVTSIGIFARRTSASTLIEGNAISGGAASGNETGSWAIYSDRGAMSVLRNRLNVDANATGTSGPSCTQSVFCGGFRGDNSFAQVKSNIIRGARAPFAAGVLMHGGDGLPGELVINGNTIDPVGMNDDSGSVSAAIVLNTVRTVDTTVGRARNNILLGGTNLKRYGVYEQKLSPKPIHLEVVSNNAFWNPARSTVGGDFAYHTWDGADETDYEYADLGQVATPTVGPSVGTDPKIDAMFHLTSGSTAVIDKGTPTEAPTHDFDGDGRPKGNGIDIGCDERQ